MNTFPDPPLPTIDDVELLLEVFTHRDLKPPSHGDSQWDHNRLVDLGAKALDAAVTYHFFEQRPCLSAEDIAENRDRFTSSATLSSWLDYYDLKRKLRVHPDQSEAITTNLEEMKTYFHTYVGALCATKGLSTIQTWISKLIDPKSNPERFSAMAPMQDGIGMRNSFNQNQITPIPPASSSSYSPLPLPLPPIGPPPPLPSAPLPPLTGSINFIPLSLVNQTAVQKGYSINYAASHEGPSHLPLWTVRCSINNVERGMGKGKSQKIAKEEAARRAWMAMGW